MPKIIFTDANGLVTEMDVKSGTTLLEAARKADVEIEAACEGSLACSTCHVILEQEHFDKLPKATTEEEDMLDMAFGLTATSRLACQIKVNDDLNNMKVKVARGR